MTLRDLFGAYASEMLVNVALYDNTNSCYLLQFRFENATGHDFAIFEKYGDARVIEWYVSLGMIHIQLDIEKF